MSISHDLAKQWLAYGPLEPFEELIEVVEDTVEYFCDKQKQSDELTWLMVKTLAKSKLADLERG